MKEWYCKVNETPGKQGGGTMREKIEQFGRNMYGAGLHDGKHWCSRPSRTVPLQAEELVSRLCEEVEQMVIPYMRGSYYYSGAEGFKQQVLALLRGDKEEGQ